MRERLLLEGGADAEPKKLTLKLKIHGCIKKIRLPILDSLEDGPRSFSYFAFLFLSMFCLYHVFGPRSTFFQAVQVVEDNPANVCLLSELGERDPETLFWPTQSNQDDSYDADLENILSLSIAKEEDGSFKVSDNSAPEIKYKNICLRADVHRGLILKANDPKLWKLSQDVDAIQTITAYKKFQTWYRKGHNNDDGATS